MSNIEMRNRHDKVASYPQCLLEEINKKSGQLELSDNKDLFNQTPPSAMDVPGLPRKEYVDAATQNSRRNQQYMSTSMERQVKVSMLQILAPKPIKPKMSNYQNMMIPTAPQTSKDSYSKMGEFEISRPVMASSPSMRGKSELDMKRIKKMNGNLKKQNKQFPTISETERLHASVNGPLPALKNQL